jgi:DNA-binding CsgD family transcriptional regulator
VRVRGASEVRNTAAPRAEPGISPAARFALDGCDYYVFRRPTPVESDGPRRDFWRHVERSCVGSLEINGARHLIVAEADTRAVAPHSSRNPVDVLTPRELQIVALVADGRPNKAIAARLRISEWTVSTHLRRIFAKLAVDSRAAMVYCCADMLRGPEQARTIAADALDRFARP